MPWEATNVFSRRRLLTVPPAVGKLEDQQFPQESVSLRSGRLGQIVFDSSLTAFQPGRFETVAGRIQTFDVKRRLCVFAR